MASISTNKKTGEARILFVNSSGERLGFRLGRHVSEYVAQTYKHNVEQILSAKKYNHACDADVVRWLAGLNDAMHDKLASVGLVDPRGASTLGVWLDGYITERETELKPKSIAKLEDAKAALLAYFNADTPLSKITPAQASEWRQDLQRRLSTASVKTYCGNVKTMMREAVKRKLIVEDPFNHLKSGSTAKGENKYILPEEINAIIEACPTSEWRLLFGLAAYAGLRIPSESNTLTLADVNFETHLLMVRSPKTEHHKNHDLRLVPISPPLMKLILARQGDMQDGETLLVNKRGGMVHRHATRFIKAAGVAPWAGLWQTLRATAEKSWAMDHPQFAVSRWIGHGMAMSEKHYLGGDIPQELIDKVTGRTPKEAAQKAAQQHSADERKASEEAGAKALTPHYDAQERSTCDIRTGGGGNRTRVPEHFRKGLYVHSRSICVSTRATPVDRLHAGPTRLFSRRVAAE